MNDDQSLQNLDVYYTLLQMKEWEIELNELTDLIISIAIECKETPHFPLMARVRKHQMSYYKPLAMDHEMIPDLV